jgi:hypothetical protein
MIALTYSSIKLNSVQLECMPWAGGFLPHERCNPVSPHPAKNIKKVCIHLHVSTGQGVNFLVWLAGVVPFQKLQQFGINFLANE